MKELSEKEKAIDVVRQMVEDGQVSQEVAEKYFPELKDSEESEDERIRKALIGHLKECRNNTRSEVMFGEYAKWIAWLEKQCEYANFRSKIQIGDKVTRNEDGVLVNLSQLNRVAKKQGENNMGISETTKQELEDNLNKALEKETPESWNEFLGEQKPTWDEEDERNLYYWLDNNKSIDNDKYRWLKSLKDRVQPKPEQEWSKEDEKIYQSIMDDIVQENQLYEKQIDWIVSLKDRYTWKPSSEQIDCLSDAVARYNREGFSATTLTSLLEQLKKLREE